MIWSPDPPHSDDTCTRCGAACHQCCCAWCEVCGGMHALMSEVDACRDEAEEEYAAMCREALEVA